jgi:hypothetical protein
MFWAPIALDAQADELTFSGEFADGVYVTGGRIGDWHDTGAQPQLNGRRLFDGQAIRWLRNDSNEQPVRPRAFVEMVGGDRLPGQVVEHHEGVESAAERQPDHLTVRVDVPIDMPDQPARTHLRVKLTGLRRIVWQRRGGDHYVPGTLFYIDGRQIEFRAVRWAPTSVVLLLAEGTRKVPFSDIAELHFPARNSWDNYYESLAVLTAECTARLMQIETFAGLVASTSLSRFQARAISGDPNGWFHMLEPAWSLDPFWVRHTHIQWRRFFLPDDVRLSQIEPSKVIERSSIGGGWRCQIDKSVHGQPLRNGGKTFGWGFGMQAFAEMHFDLPAAARQFQTRIGLDEAAGRGGCARGLVYANKREAEPLAKTKHLIGSNELVDSGPLALAGAKSLLLVADPAHADRPPGSDPFDIRDMVDWLEPVLSLDHEKLLAEVARRLPQAVPAWEDWKVELPENVKLQLANHWDNANPQNARYRLECLSIGGPLKLSRRVKLSARDRYLLLGVSRFADSSSASRIELRIDGNAVTEFDVPERRGVVPVDPLLFPLTAYHGREVLIELVQTPTSDKSWVDWRGLGLAEYTTATPWVPLATTVAKSAGETTLGVEPDGSLLASGKPADLDVYTVVAETELLGISALRLDVLTDSRLPGGGPGRANGTFILTDFRVTAAPRGKPELAEPVVFSGAAADFSNGEAPVANAIDTNPQSGWAVSAEPGRPHAAVFTTKQDLGFAGGTTLTITLDHKAATQHSLGRFRLSATNVPRPVPAEREGMLLPANWVGKALAIFEDQSEFLTSLKDGGGQMTLETGDKFSGSAAVKVLGERLSTSLPRLNVKIRQNPAAGEYRYLQFAWKKLEGQTICLQVCHDGQWGPAGNFKFRYHAGPGPEPFNGSLSVSPQLPSDWVLVTRDLFEDFGEFTMTGLALSMIDGQYAMFDHILLGRNKSDFETGK